MAPIIANVVEEPWSPHVEAIRGILDADVDEYAMAQNLRDYCRTNIPDIELMAEVFDALATQKVISKAKFRELYNL
jgi:hypothetical protein